MIRAFSWAFGVWKLICHSRHMGCVPEKVGIIIIADCSHHELGSLIILRTSIELIMDKSKYRRGVVSVELHVGYYSWRIT